ncbi:MAG: glycoside hydrolase family 16 protein [Candidatus Azobacteroides sp.]|nr:glycoside hydrolase family 16 protein [Candidatus Azobacteroides sp.]
MKRNSSLLYGLLIFSSLLACGNKNDDIPPATPSDLEIGVEIVGATADAPYGDGSGKVNLTLSGKNVTSFIVTLPTEDKTLPLNAPSGTVLCTFASHPGTTSPYPVSISAYCNTVRKDTTISVTVYCKATGEGVVWSDEFDGTSLNTGIWNYETGNNNGWGNNEKEYYTDDAANVSVKDGYLQITALHSPNYNNTGFDYTSARITTQSKYAFTYGKVEIRAKVPGDPGTWPALWMLGSNINSVPWPGCGEIDIMEQGTVTGLDNILCSLHWGGDASDSRNVPGSTTDFHLYSLDWRADHIAFYIDNSLLYSQPNNSSLPFNQNFFFILNVAVGGNMGGNNINLGSGSTMYVDYIRVYN